VAGCTKRQFVLDALAEIGIASSTFQISAAEMAASLNRLDSLMAEWDARGIHLGYPISVPEATDPDEATSVPPYANDAIVTNLAIRLASQFGRQPMPATLTAARSSLATVILRMTSTPPTLQMPGTMPVGAGNKPHMGRGPFMPRPVDPITVADEGPLTFHD
jgi:hypothetical protein